MEKDAKIYVAGHRGMVGSALVRKLEQEDYHRLLLRNSNELDLRNQAAVQEFFESEKPDYVFLAAAKVGGIHANRIRPAEFIYDNLSIQNNVIHQSWKVGVKKLLFLGSSCIYPKDAPQPIKEEYLLTGLLETTNEAYAIAKIAGIKLCQFYRIQYGCNFISAMPTNLYGPGDNYDLQTSHVMPALLRKFFEATRDKAPSVTIWGSGKPRREFLHADDAASALYFLMQHYDEPGMVNVGTGKDSTIAELAAIIKDISGYQGKLVFDTSMPDGTFRKQLDVSRLESLGWKPAKGFREGIAEVYREKFDL